MKRFFAVTILLTLLLAACAAQPTVQPASPAAETQTPTISSAGQP